MDVIFDWYLGNMIYNGLITLRLCGFPFRGNWGRFNRQLETLPPPSPPPQLAVPKNESNPENQLNPHTPLLTISMILPIARGSSMEFQTKKQKKDHLWLVNNIAVQGPVWCTDWSKTPITFLEQDLQLDSYPILMPW